MNNYKNTFNVKWGWISCNYQMEKIFCSKIKFFSPYCHCKFTVNHVPNGYSCFFRPWPLRLLMDDGFFLKISPSNLMNICVGYFLCYICFILSYAWQVCILWCPITSWELKRVLATFNSSMAHAQINISSFRYLAVEIFVMLFMCMFQLL